MHEQHSSALTPSVTQSAIVFPLSGLIPHVIKLLSKPVLPDFSGGIASSPYTNGSDSCFNLLAHDDSSSTFSQFCEDVELLHGHEDFEGHSLFSCDIHRGRWNTVMGPLKDPHGRGGLWVWNHASAKLDRSEGHLGLDDESPKPRLLRLEDYPVERDFHPLGTRFDAETARLYVVNHAREASAIEVFQLVKDASGVQATYLFTLQHPLATHTPNSIATLPGNRLIITQDHFVSKRSPGVDQLIKTYKALLPASSAFLATPLAHALNTPLIADIASRLETLLGIRGGFVTLLEWDDRENGSASSSSPRARVILSQIAFPNGLALTKSRNTLAIASTMSHSVHMYSLRADYTVNSTPSAIIPLDFLPDNIAISQRGPSNAQHHTTTDPLEGDSLIITGHADSLKLLAIAKRPYRAITMIGWGSRGEKGPIKEVTSNIPEDQVRDYRIAPARSVLVSWTESKSTQSRQQPPGLMSDPTRRESKWTYQDVYSGTGSLRVPVTKTKTSTHPDTNANAQDQSKYWTFPDLHDDSQDWRELGLDTTSAAVVDLQARLSIVVGLYARAVMVCQIDQRM